MNLLGRLVSLAVAFAFTIQSYDALSSAFKGTQPKESAPNKDPKAISTRLDGITWGLISGGLSLGLFLTAIFY
jgi:hypothetical protein